MKITKAVFSVIILYLIVFWFGPQDLQAQGKKATVTIAAAADLRFAMDSIIHLYPNKSDVQVIYGSSGKFFEQLTKGAPFDIYFSADMEYPKKLETMGRTGSEIYAYGIGRLVIWSKSKGIELNSVEDLSSDNLKKIAIANPRHAPYGMRAEESLKHYGVYEKVKPKLVFGENISQTAQFVSTGAADAGIIALSLALSPTMQKINSDFILIPENTHRPLLQGAIITQRAKENKEAKAFFEFVQSENAKAVLAYFGFRQL
ncbi:molybdate ABC transporter substrate-binding protein [Mongoliibacter ruber]|uniref:Molybdate transport system substrate-binding protein n=1 Tax=Mongoliibacter ruber TaxID=1750599 RepID=A0A2T0WFL1_9BACT|nr:molybdate ABC transporter substrate-binding protein [Mongoliibacter ruber]PRY85503.1 molybdate transport system substrate-binding protein [Mongoliibacter ruber]